MQRHRISMASPGRVYLYNNGDECTAITGGWRQASHYYNQYTESQMFGKITRYSDRIMTSGSPIGSWITGLGIKNAIDLTPYTKAHIKIKFYERAVLAYFSNNDTGYGWAYNREGGAVGFGTGSSTQIKEFDADISNITGSWHIGFWMGEKASSTYAEITMYEFWLE